MVIGIAIRTPQDVEILYFQNPRWWKTAI